ncbi:sigma-70 family RNA polymerase sigma factor [Kribbella sp. NPDC004536]|uniref:sigma-70 family RNA polymerase sigma factor n=1 Tax=Kribbella sp. NPDC004536 TaxID=3364106 RepID=UPI0036B22321
MAMSADVQASELDAAWRQFAGELRRFIAGRVSSPHDAEDILQLVFMRLAAQPDGLQNGDRVAPWLYTTTRNAITDYYRSASRRRELPVDSMPDAANTTEDDADDSEAKLARCLVPLIERLPRDQAEALRMVDVAGMSQSAAAAVAVVSVPGMKSRVQRGRSKLREMLLACCEIQRDSRGRVMDFDGRGNACGAESTHTASACGCSPQISG